ncbi:MAG: DUF4402 domain-containing protein [Tannerellaceae bacterium]
MKKNYLVIVMMVLFSTIGIGTTYAQIVSTQDIGVTARLAKQLTITKQSDVDFGGIFIPTTATAVVTLDNQNNVTITSGTTNLFSTELQKSGAFYITADPSATYTIQYPQNVRLALSDGTSALNYQPQLFNQAGNLIASSASTQYTVSVGQYHPYKIGGQLAIPNTAKSGTHTGTFDITVTWQ